VEMLPDSYEITVQDLQNALRRQNLTLQAGDAVIVNTGWGKLWGKDNARYMKTRSRHWRCRRGMACETKPDAHRFGQLVGGSEPESRPENWVAGAPNSTRGKRHPHARKPEAG